MFDSELNDKVASVWSESGTWMMYQHFNYAGSSVTVCEGQEVMDVFGVFSSTKPTDAACNGLC